ncbi:MAG: NUDIX hydrolase [Methylomicrobium sp.]
MNDKNPTFFPTPAIGVGGIVFNHRDEVLLIRRNQPPANGYWSIPGGKLEPGESLAEACCREFEEETGLRVRIVSLVALVERRIEDFHYVIADFWVELTDDSAAIPTANSDVSEALWISLERLDDYQTVTGLAVIIEKTYHAYRAGRTPGLIDSDGSLTDFI